MLVAGIDISERRGQTVALLDSEDGSAVVTTLETVAAVVDLLQSRAVAVAAVDSALQPSRLLLRHDEERRRYGVPDRRGMNGPVYANYRVCDYELIRRRMPLYQVAASYEACRPWMRAGFNLAAILLDRGYRLPRHDQDHDATLLEVFPHAGFVTLLGGRPARKSGARGALGRAQRRAALTVAGIRVEPTWSHDDLDAVVAALTALRWRQEHSCALGAPEEGLIVLPVPCDELRERYGPLASAEAGA